MPELIPLRSFYYKIGKESPERLRELVAPPYDVISEEELIEMKKNPDNICHIILPKTYKEAGQKLKQLINTNQLVHEENRCICIYGIEYKKPDTGELITRYGFVGLLKLVEIFPANDGVVPHEMTFTKFTEDRLNLIQETDSNFSPIFTIYNGNGTAENLFNKYIYERPFLQTQDRDGFTHKIWKVWEEEDIRKFQEIVKKHSIIIADGHHRYITSLRHSRHGGCNYIMALFIDFNDPGLIIYTNQRQVIKLPVKNIDELKQKLEKYFELTVIEDYNKLKDLMKELKNEDKHVFGCYYQDHYLLLKLRDNIRPEREIQGKHSDEWKNLDLPILHDILLTKCLNINPEDISYIKDVKNGLKNVDEKIIQALFIVNPTTLQEIHKITHLGEIMPQKSTYFYPKPLSGLIVHIHSNEVL
ncbi:MAG: DUF1015 domain-containing protein [Promethearchaeota archaeon]|nr:MAG: DUF1015 domain-containing protein [Candidatus Lokiarchaeota archaeon]